MKSILLKTLLFLIMIPVDLLAMELIGLAKDTVIPPTEEVAVEVEPFVDHFESLQEQETAPQFDYTKHSDQEYKQMIVGIWQLQNPIAFAGNQYSTTLEFGSTGMLKVLMSDINNPTKIFNEAYGYYDIKNGCITATFYNETHTELGLGTSSPHNAAFGGSLSNQQMIIYRGAEYTLNKV